MKRLFATALTLPILALAGKDVKSRVATHQASDQGMAAGCGIMTQTETGEDIVNIDFIRLILIHRLTQTGAL